MSDSLNPKRVCVAQIGARRHYAVPRALWAAGRLDRLYTDVYAGERWARLLGAVLPAPLRRGRVRRLLEREIPDVPPERIRTFPGFGLARLAHEGRAGDRGARMAYWLERNRAFCARVAAAGFGPADAVYVFNGAGLEVLRAARSTGRRAVVDQTSAPLAVEEALLEEERAAWPGWEPAVAGAGAWRALAEREEEEWGLADRIVCGSAYVADAVAARRGPSARCRVVPYGCPRPAAPAPEPKPAGSGALRVLFVGTLELRKGFPYLVKAAQRLRGPSIRFRAVGPSRLTPAADREVAGAMTCTGPVSRADVVRQYDEADVLAVPSISEGSANVSYEALARGVPVVATPNAGTVVRDGEDGLLVPIRSVDGLVDAFERLASDGALLRRLSAQALQRARTFGWGAYVERLAAAIGDGGA